MTLFVAYYSVIFLTRFFFSALTCIDVICALLWDAIYITRKKEKVLPLLQSVVLRSPALFYHPRRTGFYMASGAMSSVLRSACRTAPASQTSFMAHCQYTTERPSVAGWFHDACCSCTVRQGVRALLFWLGGLQESPRVQTRTRILLPKGKTERLALLEIFVACAWVLAPAAPGDDSCQHKKRQQQRQGYRSPSSARADGDGGAIGGHAGLKRDSGSPGHWPSSSGEHVTTLN